MNLLIADDTAEVLNFLQDFFVKAGHSVFCARDGEEALKILQNEEIDGIFCALTMPKLGGLDFNWGVRYYRGRSIILWDTLRDFKS